METIEGMHVIGGFAAGAAVRVEAENLPPYEHVECDGILCGMITDSVTGQRCVRLQTARNGFRDIPQANVTAVRHSTRPLSFR